MNALAGPLWQGKTWDIAAFSQVGICEQHLYWKHKLKQTPAQLGALNYQLSPLTALALRGPFFYIQCLCFLSQRCDQQMCTEKRGPWQIRGCYLQGPFLKNAYIFYWVLETWHAAGMKLASVVVNIHAVVFHVGWDSSYIPRVKVSDVFGSKYKVTVCFSTLRNVLLSIFILHLKLQTVVQTL